MSNPVSISNYPKLSKTGLAAVYGMGYKENEMVLPAYFDIRNSEFAYEEMQEIIGTGLAREKNQGAPMAFDTLQQGVTTRLDNVTYGLGLEVTMEEKKDNKYNQVVNKVKSLKRSIMQTKETLGANVLNRATTAGYVGGDGVVLLSASHPTANGTQSNIVSGSLSEATLEDAITDIMDAVDSRGLKINLRPKQLIVPTALQFDAERICRSNLQADTAENNMNVIKSKNYIPNILRNVYLTNNTQWFIQTTCDNGLTYFENIPDSFEEDKSTSILADQYFAYFRGVFGWGDWRNIYGSTGA